MLEEAPPEQLLEWMEFYQLDPWGPERDDIRIAMLCALVANAVRGRKGRAFKVADFMPRFDGSSPQRHYTATTGEQMAALAKSWFGGKEKPWQR